jgi:hypothetical protein
MADSGSEEESRWVKFARNRVNDIVDLGHKNKGVNPSWAVWVIEELVGRIRTLEAENRLIRAWINSLPDKELDSKLNSKEGESRDH